MEYRITAELSLPAGSAELDGLQQQGAAALLAEWLDRVATVEGPDGVEITPYDHELDTHPSGAVIELLVDAPALSFAENGAEALLYEILERTELLADWKVGKCEVTVSDAELAEALESHDGSETAPASGVVGVPPEEIAAQHRRLLGLAPQLRAFDADSFGPSTDVDDARLLAAGALIDRAVALTDELFMDVTTLEDDAHSLDEDDTSWTADDSDELFVLHDLPVRYRHHYDVMFAKKFLLSSAAVYARLTRPGWARPTSTAEALALYVLVENAKDILVSLAGLDAGDVNTMFSAFDDAAQAHHDHEWLYLEDLDAIDPDDSAADPLGFLARNAHSWFDPYPDSVDTAPHPYLIDEG
ncbi:hypothetical protein [Nocardiopsis ansamitocini]|uniref:Uncharacterized protein n=1 Tax=Nocardiopsis ansamitocini TaxID=1670832 RepID=A0A9W6UIH1_9ACTN|nr:hypothetical protein [Nocardiopsis ansamitocini]GLU47687.1 hypothetical protein Nans01_20380 [Nocardiopsis ansamitocini]